VSDDVRTYWDEQAAEFDEAADHGLRDAAVRSAWQALLMRLLPAPPARVADLGCGTGSLSVLMAEAGHHVSGIDLSERMVAAARAKAPDIEFGQGDASHPPYEAGSLDVVLTRHVLWALPDPADALARWTRLLRPDGRLVLIEGRWSTGAGIAAADCRDLVLDQRQEAVVELLDDPALWSRPIDGEHYALLSRE
jgi:ubiquinone/menaquinone biosynthesis C-methylase UbiE